MIGGTVTETVEDRSRIWVKVADDKHFDSCAINVVNNDEAKKIKPGDSIWWQGTFAMWTPYENRSEARRRAGITTPQRAGVDFDIQIPRVGYSGAPRPTPIEQDICSVCGKWLNDCDGHCD